MKSFLLAAVAVLLSLATKAVTVPTPVSVDNFCIGESFVDPADNFDTPSYSAAVSKSGIHIYFQKHCTTLTSSQILPMAVAGNVMPMLSHQMRVSHSTLESTARIPCKVTAQPVLLASGTSTLVIATADQPKLKLTLSLVTEQTTHELPSAIKRFAPSL